MNNNIQISKNKVGKNILDAISNGAAEGVKLAVNVAGMLLYLWLLSLLPIIIVLQNSVA